MLAREAEARISTLNSLDAEKGRQIGAADAKALGFLEKSSAELQEQASRLKRQLADLRSIEITKAEKESSGLVRRIEGAGRSAEATAKRAGALFELKAVNRRLERLRSLEAD